MPVDVVVCLYVMVRLCTMSHMSTSMTVSEARAVLPQLLDRVSAGEEVTITRHGRPAAVLVRPDTLRARRADEALAGANMVRDALERGRKAPLSARPVLREIRADALVEEVRTARSLSR
jgi:prevent-host-death family protein